MEIAVLFQVVNLLFIGFVILLKMNKLIGVLVTTYGLIWGVSILLFAVFSPESLPFITLRGIAVIYGHFLCLIGAALYSRNFYKGGEGIHLYSISSKKLYLITLVISSFGILMTLYTTDFWTFYVQNQLAELRGELFEQKIIVNKYYKLMGNLIYPLAIIAPVYYFRRSRNILVLIAVVVLGALLSFSNGGKGNLIMVLILLAGSTIYMCYVENYKLPRILKRSAIGVLILLLGFFYLISASRVEDNSGYSLLETIALTNQYFSGSIPSLCQWLESNQLPLLDFNMMQLSLLREIAAIFGFPTTRVIDQQIVNVPYPFNVFTAFADSLAAFGYIGSLIYYLGIGALLGYIDRLKKSPLLFGIMFLFVGYSLFTDVFFYMIGSWICLFFNYMFQLDEAENP